MKLKSYNLCTLIVLLLFINPLRSQHMHTDKELQLLKAQAEATKKMGRSAIIEMAAKVASEDPEAILQDENIDISVWYNELQVQVRFISRAPIFFIPHNSSCYTAMEINVTPDGVSGKSGTLLSSPKSYHTFDPTFLYHITKEIATVIITAVTLNNANDDVSPIDASAFTGTKIIREYETYYEIQLGDRYPITYNIDKTSGKVSEYDDPYGDSFFPTPATLIGPTPMGGEWIEMKE